MKVIKGKKKINKNFFRITVRLVILAFIFYTSFILINQYVQINNKKETLDNLNSQLEVQKTKNDELKKIAQATDEENEEYFVRIARELNLSKHDERIFVNISGN